LIRDKERGEKVRKKLAKLKKAKKDKDIKRH